VDPHFGRAADMSYGRTNPFLRSNHQIGRRLDKLATASCVIATLATLLSIRSTTADDLATCFGPDADAAISACTAIIASQERSPTELAQAHVLRGTAYFNKGNYDNALKDYNEAIELDPSNPVASYDRGNIRNSVGQYKKAIDDYTKAIELKPTYAAAFNNRCFAYNAKADKGDKDDYDRAVYDCRRAIQLDPKQMNSYLGLGNALNNKGEYDKSLQAYDDAIRWDDKNAKAFLGRCSVYIKISKFNDAIEACSQAVQLEASDPIGWNNRCWARAVVGQLQSALDDCNQALKIHASDPYSLDSRALTFLKMGSFDQAIADYDQALLLQPGRTTSLYGRGIARLKKGDIAGSNNDINAAKQEDPSIVSQFRKYGVQ
jgi:tetratricopeptide (TPR) repeat protein